MLRRRRTPPPASSTTREASPVKLPLKCHSCGAPVRPNEVEYIDEATAECDYCGSTLVTE